MLTLIYWPSAAVCRLRVANDEANNSNVVVCRYGVGLGERAEALQPALAAFTIVLFTISAPCCRSARWNTRIASSLEKLDVVAGQSNSFAQCESAPVFHCWTATAASRSKETRASADACIAEMRERHCGGLHVSVRSRNALGGGRTSCAAL